MSVRVMHDVGAEEIEKGKRVRCPVCYAERDLPCIKIWGKESVHSARVDVAEQLESR